MYYTTNFLTIANEKDMNRNIVNVSLLHHL